VTFSQKYFRVTLSQNEHNTGTLAVDNKMLLVYHGVDGILPIKQVPVMGLPYNPWTGEKESG